MADIVKVTRLGISSVPFFVFSGTFALSGAQAPETCRAALERSIPAGHVHTGRTEFVES